VGWIVKLVSTGAEGEEHGTDVLQIARPDDLTGLASLGLTLAEGKRLLAGVQQEIVAARARVHATRRPECRSCGVACRVKDYRQHKIATLFGQVTVRLPRFRCGGCGTIATGMEWPRHARSTPEFDRLRAQLSALLTYRTAAEVLGQMFPIDAGTAHKTLRHHTFGVAEAGVTGLPILDWFHLAMRLQHLTQVAGSLSSESSERAAAKAVTVEEVERLRWRLWNGKAQDAQISLDRIRAVMHSFQGEPNGRRSIAPSRKLWTALRALNTYLTGQSDWLVNYAERHRAGQRVGTALTEGTANFLMNRRMNKSQQMRWTRRGADRLLQIRSAVYNGTLGTGSGQRFQAVNDPHPPAAIAA
jgi:hypothetical protein